MIVTRRMFLMAAAMAFLQLATACIPKNCKIPQNRKLVCGSDSRTYSNKEELECFREQCYPKLRLVKNRPCDERCRSSQPYPFPFLIDPVCGSDGRVYRSRDHLESYRMDCSPGMHVVEAGYNVLKTHRCSCEYSVCAMPKIRDPVCGSNGKTYVNEDELLCHQRDCYHDLHIVRRGVCMRQS